MVKKLIVKIKWKSMLNLYLNFIYILTSDSNTGVLL